jgi:hypothetical protein
MGKTFSVKDWKPEMLNVNAGSVEKIDVINDVERIVEQILKVSDQCEKVKSDQNKGELLITMNVLNETLENVCKPKFVIK